VFLFLANFLATQKKKIKKMPKFHRYKGFFWGQKENYPQLPCYYDGFSLFFLIVIFGQQVLACQQNMAQFLNFSIFLVWGSVAKFGEKRRGKKKSTWGSIWHSMYGNQSLSSWMNVCLPRPFGWFFVVVFFVFLPRPSSFFFTASSGKSEFLCTFVYKCRGAFVLDCICVCCPNKIVVKT
jgi:hypothetical protein